MPSSASHIAINVVAQKIDGVTTVNGIQFSGVPDGVTLNHGSYNAVTHIWTLLPADLAGLNVNASAAIHAGSYDITVDGALNGAHLGSLPLTLAYNGGGTLFSIAQSGHDFIGTANGREIFDVSIGSDGLYKISFDGHHEHVDSVPTIASPVPVSVDEASLSPSTTITGHVSVNYGNDTAAGVTTNGAFSASGSEADGHVTSHGQTVTISHSSTGYTGTAGGATVFTLTVQPSGDYSFTQFKPLDHADATNPHDVITLNFGIRATDTDGDSATGIIKVNVKDDAPMAHDDAVSFAINTGHTTGNVVTGAGETAGGADVLSHDTTNMVNRIMFGTTAVDVPGTGAATINGAHGTLVIAASGAYTYTANSGGTDQFQYRLTDADGDASVAKLTVNATVSPTISLTVNGDQANAANAPDAVVQENGTFSVPIAAHLNNPAANESMTVMVTGIPSAGVGTVTPGNGGVYDAAHGTITWTLQPGQSLDTHLGFHACSLFGRRFRPASCDGNGP